MYKHIDSRQLIDIKFYNRTMENKCQDDLIIERIDRDYNYELLNYRCIYTHIQSRNNKYQVLGYIITDLCRMYNIPQITLRYKLENDKDKIIRLIYYKGDNNE